MKRKHLSILVAALVACGPAAAPTGVPTAAPTLPPVPSVAPTLAPTAAPTGAPAPVGTPALNQSVLVRGLDTPWAIDFAPDGRAFVTERAGRIRVIRDGQLMEEPWLTLEVVETGESGLMGIAVDPQFQQTRYLYAAYTLRAANGLQNRVVRLKDEPGSNKGKLDKVLLESIPGAATHDGARVRFGPDGKLYVTMGDAQTPQAAQDRNSLSGKVLRLNSDGSIPADNPFPGSPVYSYGHRNPQGLAWQPATGRLYVSEHGPSGTPCCQDELNFVEPGKNYGWPTITGDATREGMVGPIRQSGATATWAPGGMAFVSKGPWAGTLFMTGLRGQALYRVSLDREDPRKVVSFEPMLLNQYGRLRDVVEGPDGALYLLTSNRDGRGQPAAEDDRIIKLSLQ